MNLNEYQDLACSTAVYPGVLMYPALGLAGEGAEFIDKMWSNTSNEDRSKELGDMLWYTATTAADANLKLSECAGVGTFDELEGLEHEEWLHAALARATGPIFENVKKTFRDDGGVLTEARQETIRVHIGKVLNVLAEYATELGTTLDKVAAENYAKLKSRQERGKLQGSGDNR